MLLGGCFHRRLLPLTALAPNWNWSLMHWATSRWINKLISHDSWMQHNAPLLSKHCSPDIDLIMWRKRGEILLSKFKMWAERNINNSTHDNWMACKQGIWCSGCQSDSILQLWGASSEDLTLSSSNTPVSAASLSFPVTVLYQPGYTSFTQTRTHAQRETERNSKREVNGMKATMVLRLLSQSTCCKTVQEQICRSAENQWRLKDHCVWLDTIFGICGGLP